jgi:MYXO-CTERM domain-containing protein
MKGERCVDGVCQGDPCAGVQCAADQVCAITGGVGVCVTNMCVDSGCGSGQACCGGACNDDPCRLVRCPEGIACVVDGACNATCSAPMTPMPPTGSGGCQIAPRGEPSWLALLIAGALILLRRRRREAR